MYEKYLEQLEEAGKIRNLKERSINCYKNYTMRCAGCLHAYSLWGTAQSGYEHLP